MKKTVLILVAIVLISSGLYGTYYFYQVYRAGQEIRTAMVYLREEDYTQAVETLRDTIGRYPYKPVQESASFFIADSYRRAGRFEAAVESYQSLIDDDAMSDRSYWRIKALTALSQVYRNVPLVTQQRRTSILEALKEEVHGLLLFQRDGENMLFRRASRWWKSMVNGVLLKEAYITSLHLNHDSLVEELQTELGFLYLETGEMDRAEYQLSDIDTPRAKFGLAKVYLQTSRYEQGFHLLESIIPYDQTDKVFEFYQKQAFDTAENLYDLGKTAQALDLFERLVVRGDQRYQDLAGYRLAEHYYREHAYTAALDYIDKVLVNQVNLRDEQATLMKGYILYDQRKYVKALRTFNSFLSRYQGSSRSSTAREWKRMCERVIRYYG
jgi:tetratricopeptide (TPR) repeat protein